MCSSDLHTHTHTHAHTHTQELQEETLLAATKFGSSSWASSLMQGGHASNGEVCACVYVCVFVLMCVAAYLIVLNMVSYAIVSALSARVLSSSIAAREH